MGRIVTGWAGSVVVCTWGGVVVFAACSSSPPSLDSTWEYADSASESGNGLTLKSNGTYVSSILSLTSSTSANAQIETGTFKLSGSEITFTPQQWSCPEATDPPYSAGFEQNGDTLTLSYSSGAIAYQLDTSTASTFALSDGCFLQDGTFIASPLAAVGTCVAAGDACSNDTTCCLGNACVNANGGVCAGTCTMNSDCTSGCCTGMDSVPCPQGAFGMCGYCDVASACEADAG
jgi:hypothetical protein